MHNRAQRHDLFLNNILRILLVLVICFLVYMVYLTLTTDDVACVYAKHAIFSFCGNKNDAQTTYGGIIFIYVILIFFFATILVRSFLKPSEEEKQKWEKVDKLAEFSDAGKGLPNAYAVTYGTLFFIISIIVWAAFMFFSNSSSDFVTSKIGIVLLSAIGIAFIAFIVQLKPFSGKPQGYFDKQTFIKSIIILAVILFISLSIIRQFPETTEYFQKAGFFLLSLICPWFIKVSFRTGNLPTRFGDISRKNNPGLFILGVGFYVVIFIIFQVIIFCPQIVVMHS
ncbi:MAG: hypothetical protein HQL26_05540 [Candidatus Omnitrophica bacterium]|nr:hypothetical protein [Candidatus Omnitrophota bacterium]